MKKNKLTGRKKTYSDNNVEFLSKEDINEIYGGDTSKGKSRHKEFEAYLLIRDEDIIAMNTIFDKK